MRAIGNAVKPAREIYAVASGALATGDTVVVNSDGTVSVIEEVIANNASSGSPVAYLADSIAKTNMGLTFDSNSNKVLVTYFKNQTYAKVGTVSGDSISYGSAAQITSNTGEEMSATFDSNSNKVVVAYQDDSNSNKGTAAVGTISGTSVSFGTPVVFEQGSTFKTSCAFDSNSNKVVIAYIDAGNSSYGTAVVGTVSGTSISFGTPVVFESAEVSGNIGITFDSSNNKIVISYYDDPASDGTAIVGTVSGTSISFGTPVVFSSTMVIGPTCTFDSNSNKVVIAYRDFANSSRGAAIVGTVSGTSISFGTAVVFEANAIEQPFITFDSSTNRVVIAYRDSGNSNYGTAITGNVSGTSLSFGTKVVYLSSGIENPNITFDSENNKAVAIAVDDDSSDHGKSSVITPTSLGTNLTAENYIGTSQAGYADTQTAAINVKGAIEDKQSGLTAGQSYYVQTDGTLGTTPADPSVFAGTAVSATKLIVKG